MQKQRETFILVFLILFFSLGCVTEKEISGTENEKVMSLNTADMDADTMTDIKKYTFRPIIVDVEDNIIMQKTVTAAQTKNEILIISTNTLNESDISNLETLIYRFDNDRKEKEGECEKRLGTGKISCESPKKCAELCSTSYCQKYGYANEFIGYWVYEFVQNKKALDADVAEVKNALIIIKDAETQQKEYIMEKLNAIKDRTILINTNPLLNKNMFGICENIEYENSLIKEMSSILGKYHRQPSEYTYVVNIKFVITSKTYAELNVTDALPKAMLAKLKKISMIGEGNSYNAQMNIIKIAPIKLNVYPEYVLQYSFQSGQNMREDIFNAWPTPQLTVKTVSLFKSPLILFIFNTSKYVYSQTKEMGYYPALAIVLVFWDILILLGLLGAKITINLIKATFLKISLRESMLKSFGSSNPYWKEYLVGCILFFGIGYGALFFASPVSESILVVDNIPNHLIQNPFGAISLLFLFLSFHIAYSLLEDRFKGVVIGRKYYENINEISPKANELRFKKLEEKKEILKQLLESAGQIEVSEEKKVFVSVPMERIKELMKRPGNERATKELMMVYLEKIEQAIIQVDEKIKICKNYWKEWSKEISEKLEKQESIPLSFLTGIPKEWRLWAANKFALENVNEGFVVDKECIKRCEDTIEKKAANIIKKLIKNKTAIGAGIIKKDGTIEWSSSIGNNTLEKVLSWKIISYANTLSQKILGTEYKSIVVIGANNAIVFIKRLEFDGVIFASKDKIKNAFAEFEAKIK